MTGMIFLGISKPKDNIKLESVNLKSDKDNSMFAIMLEQNDGTYKEDNSNIWPTSGYAYNESMSGCIDGNGNEIENSLSYNIDTKNVSIRTKEASYCYLYFSLPKTAPGTMLEGEENITFTLEGGLYRYQGTQEEVDNNYICFGTYNQNECLSDTNTYIYRIIGVTEDNNLKLIKKETFEIYETGLGCLHSASFGWYSGTGAWPTSEIYQQLNGINYSEHYTFINGSLYPYMTTNSEWYNMIESVDWKYGETGYNNHSWNYNGQSVYAVENGFTDSVNAKIGLMYIHDYYYAYKGGIPGSASNTKTSWIHLSHNDTQFSTCGIQINEEDILMTFSELDDEPYVWQISSSGDAVARGTDSDVIRPVFYLKPNIKITGEGTIDNPFIIN